MHTHTPADHALCRLALYTHTCRSRTLQACSVHTHPCRSRTLQACSAHTHTCRSRTLQAYSVHTHPCRPRSLQACSVPMHTHIHLQTTLFVPLLYTHAYTRTWRPRSLQTWPARPLCCLSIFMHTHLQTTLLVTLLNILPSLCDLNPKQLVAQLRRWCEVVMQIRKSLVLRIVKGQQGQPHFVFIRAG